MVPNVTWLVYSKQENGGYCLPCVLFVPSGHQNSNPGVLVNRPLKSFSKGLELFRKHVDKEHHKIAVLKADELKKTNNDQSPTKYSK